MFEASVFKNPFLHACKLKISVWKHYWKEKSKYMKIAGKEMQMKQEHGQNKFIIRHKWISVELPSSFPSLAPAPVLREDH